MFLFKTDKYHKMTDAQLESEAAQWGIKEYGYTNGTISRKIIIEQLLAKDNAQNSEVAKFFSIVSLIIASIGSFLSIYINDIQISGIRSELNAREIDYALRFDEKLTSGVNYKISIAIEKEKPLLRKNGGQFTTDDLDTFLGTYNQLSDAYDKDLISAEIIYSNFEDSLLKTYGNKEIQEYLRTIRTKDENYFQGFDSLAKLFLGDNR